MFWRSIQKPEVFLPAQLFFLGAVGLPLDPQSLDPVLRTAQKFQKGIHRCQHGIHRPDGIALLLQRLLVIHHQRLVQQTAACIGRKFSDIPHIFIHCGCAALILAELLRKSLQHIAVYRYFIHCHSLPDHCLCRNYSGIIIPRFSPFFTI